MIKKNKERKAKNETELARLEELASELSLVKDDEERVEMLLNNEIENEKLLQQKIKKLKIKLGIISKKDLEA